MGAAADFDIPFYRRSFEFIEQPARIFIRDDAVPFTSDQGNWSLHQGWIVTQRTMPSPKDVAEGPERDFHPRGYPRRCACPAAAITIEVAFTPFVEVRFR